MKKRIFYFLAFFVLAFIFSCKKVEKDVMNYYPVVETLSATVLTDGTVLVKGKITSEGPSNIEYAGFCFDTIPNVNILSNQVITPVNNNEFSFIYEGFSIDKTYFFKTWAATDIGFLSYGNVISLDSITAVPVVAPCSPTANTIKHAASLPTQSVYSADLPVQNVDFRWEIVANTSAGSYTFEFPKRPKTGIYYADQLSIFDQQSDVHVYFYTSYGNGSLNDGSVVYVNQHSFNSFTITVCEGFHNIGSGTVKLTAKFDCPF